MIRPAQGLANFLKNESSEGDEEVSETEEVTESESGSTKDRVLEELNKETVDEVSKSVVTSLTKFPPLSSLQKESLAKAVDNFSKMNTQKEKKFRKSY